MIFHLSRAQEWLPDAAAHESPSLAKEGFVHCSTAEQLEATAHAYFFGVDDLLLVAIEEDRLTSELRWEDSHGDGRLFPHLYGLINSDAVVSVTPWTPDADGVFRRNQYPGVAPAGA
ncbi:MAG: DUF952 domain-containing protein [Acidimicrobiales bacterium]